MPTLVNRKFAALLVLLTAAGCGKTHTRNSSKDVPADLQGGAPCESALDCDPGFLCDGGQCTQDTSSFVGTCVSDTDCPSTYYCDTDAGTCVLRDTGTCSEDSDCLPGLMCQRGTGQCVECLVDDHCPFPDVCRADGTCGEQAGCTSDAQCDGLVCDIPTGQCTECISDAHCDAGRSCSQGRCVIPGVACTDNMDCLGQGLICNETTGMCGACTSDAQCGNGLVCNAGTCTFDGGTGNPGNLGGDFCLTSADCGGQGCFIFQCMPCAMDFMCDFFSGETCNLQTGMCEFPQTVDPPDPDPECTVDADCGAGRLCQNEVCVDEPIDPPDPITATLGEACAADHITCEDGTFCMSTVDTSFCTKHCIGAGNDDADECPLGSACHRFTDDTFDGLQVCVPGSEIDASFPGQPFDVAPGQSCTEETGCQTGFCDVTGSCGRLCLGDGDCAASEACYTAWDPDNGPIGINACVASDTTQFSANGTTCTNGSECDSGVCFGQCGSGGPCNSNSECGLFDTCEGTCVPNCRTNDECPSGQVCNPWAMDWSAGGDLWTGVCSDRFSFGTAPDGESCTAHEDCESEWCVGEICTAPCGTNSDCSDSAAGTDCAAVEIAEGGWFRFCLP